MITTAICDFEALGSFLHLLKSMRQMPSLHRPPISTISDHVTSRNLPDVFASRPKMNFLAVQCFPSHPISASLKTTFSSALTCPTNSRVSGRVPPSRLSPSDRRLESRVSLSIQNHQTFPLGDSNAREHHL